MFVTHKFDGAAVGGAPHRVQRAWSPLIFGERAPDFESIDKDASFAFLWLERARDGLCRSVRYSEGVLSTRFCYASYLRACCSECEAPLTLGLLTPCELRQQEVSAPLVPGGILNGYNVR